MKLNQNCILILIIVVTFSQALLASKLPKRHNYHKTNKTQNPTEAPDTDNHGFIDVETSHQDQEHFSEAELQRLCPSHDIEILKNMLSPHTNCTTSNINYWHDQCLCFYEKKIHCPNCPDSSSAVSSHNTSLNFMINHNKTSCFNESKSSSSGGSGSQFNLHNSAGGIINLYFYLNGNGNANASKPTNNATTLTPLPLPPLSNNNASTKKPTGQ